MSSYRFIDRTLTPMLPKQTVSGITPIQTPVLDVTSMASVAFQFNYAAGLNASFQILGSLDGVTFGDMQAVITPATGIAGGSIGTLDVGALKYVCAQVTPISGSAAVTVLGFAKSRP